MFFQSQPYTVKELCERCIEQRNNPLFNEPDITALRSISVMIEGKNKADALRLLDEFRDNHYPMSAEASWARLSRIRLTYPK